MKTAAPESLMAFDLHSRLIPSAIKQESERLLRAIGRSPLRAEFHNREGVTVMFCLNDYTPPFSCRYEFTPERSFFRSHELARALESRGLAVVDVRGLITFQVSLTGAGAAFLRESVS